MEKQQKIDNWVQLTKYVHYIETLIEKNEAILQFKLERILCII